MWHPFCFPLFGSSGLTAAFVRPDAHGLIFRYFRFDLPVMYDASGF